MEDYGESHNVYPFDLSPDKCNLLHTHVGEHGSLDLDLGFLFPLEKNITVLVLASFVQVFTIDPRTGKPSTDLLPLDEWSSK